MDLNYAVDEWNKEVINDKTGNNYNTHLSKAITKNKKRHGTLHEIGIENVVKERLDTNRDNTETISQYQIEQAQTIEALIDHILSLEATKGQAYSSHIPPLVTLTKTLNDMSQISIMLHAIMAEPSQTTYGGSSS